jgi:hypothetical protein
MYSLTGFGGGIGLDVSFILSSCLTRPAHSYVPFGPPPGVFGVPSYVYPYGIYTEWNYNPKDRRLVRFVRKNAIY